MMRIFAILMTWVILANLGSACHADLSDYIFKEFDKENKARNFVKAVNKECGYEKPDPDGPETNALGYYYDVEKEKYIVECLAIWGTDTAKPSKKNRIIIKEEIAAIVVPTETPTATPTTTPTITPTATVGVP